MYFAQALFQRSAASSRFSCSARERWGLNVKALRSPLVIRRMKSVTLRFAFCALRRRLSDALARSRCSMGPSPNHSKSASVTTRMARQPKYMPSSFCVRGWVTFMKPASLKRAMARSQRRWPIPESRTIVRMSMSMKPLAAVGVPKHMEAKSR